MFKFSKKTREERTMVAVYEELLSSSEDYLMRTIGQAIGATGGSFPDSIDPEMVSVVNQGLEYWKESKNLMLQAAKIADDRQETLEHELDEVQKFMDQQAVLLREQSRTLDEISKKLDKTSKTKAE
jgi:hypothetical protein